MSSYRARIAWSAGAALLCVAGWLFAGSGGKPHLADTACGNCHLVAGKEVNQAQAKRLIAAQETLCGACHKNVKRMSHPTGFVPNGKLPADFPVDWKQDMTCSTCHDVHGSQPGLLRGEKRGMELCLSCHDNRFFDSMKDAGVSLQQSGHAIGDMARLDSMGDIDPLSLQCIGCHNGQVEPGGIKIGRNGLVRHGSGSANHPIGIPYPTSSAQRQFRPKAILPSAIWLPNGKLSCVSCHQPYKKEHGKLVLPNDRSSLCMQCHIP